MRLTTRAAGKVQLTGGVEPSAQPAWPVMEAMANWAAAGGEENTRRRRAGRRRAWRAEGAMPRLGEK